MSIMSKIVPVSRHKNKLSLLQNFIQQHEHLPEQGSDEWKVQRLNRIGGSEIASVLKQNKNKSVNKLIMEKLNFDKFTGNVITCWGNVFEELIRLYTEEIFKCSIKETGSIPYELGYLSYSPDGVSIVSNSNLEQHINLDQFGLNESEKEFLTLFEFKCPHSRIPSHEIPIHYKPQITIGMNIINIMEVGVFIQAVYRRCAFADIMYNSLHNGFGHFKRAEVSGNPLEVGFMVMYCEDESYANDLVEYLRSDRRTQFIGDHEIVDIGSIYNAESFEEIMMSCVSKQIKVDYIFRNKYVDRVFAADGMTQAFYNISLQHRATTALNQAIDKYGDTIIGILPYKLLDIYITPVQKEPEYITTSGALVKAKKVIDCINDHREIGDTDKTSVSKSVRSYKL